MTTLELPMRCMVVKHDSDPLGEILQVRFANGYGVSVARGPHTYGGPKGFYELAVLKFKDEGSENWGLCYDTPVTNDVEGWLTPEKVVELAHQVNDLPPHLAAKNPELSQA